VLSGLVARLPYLLAVDWPLVPNHIDLPENDIHVGPQTGGLTGVVDWVGAQVGPFGMSLGGVENILGIAKKRLLPQIPRQPPRAPRNVLQGTIPSHLAKSLRLGRE
jgi:hypothetical protein